MPDNDNLIGFQGFDKRSPSIIKVIGVGGGGCNAVQHMYEHGFSDVTFAVCNTDADALSHSHVEKRVQLGDDGLGVGGDPQKGRLATEKSVDEIREILHDGTRMVFVTTGLGGGTGTGGAPVIARVAKEMGILTVGIVTIPFRYEGMNRIDKAMLGLEEMSKNVDSLMVINNERLFQVYPTKTAKEAFVRADDTLSVAAKSIAEIITVHGIVNLDFRDVCTVMKDGGVAIMSTGYGDGDNRVTEAIQNALHSPLLNNSDIYRSKRLLLNITFCRNNEGESLMMDEMNEIHDFMSRFDPDVETKFGIANDESLGKKVKVTILATGFMLNDVIGDVNGQHKEPTTPEDDMRRQELDDRRGKYYDDTDANRMRHSYRVYKFSTESLDNDEIISMVETSPTYKRTNELLRSINSLTQSIKPAQTQQSDSQPNTIVF